MKNIVPRLRSIQVKVVALFMVVALFTVMSSAILIIIYEIENSKEKEQHRIDSIAEILAPTLTAAVVFNDELAANELLLPLMSDSTIMEAKVLLTNKELFVDIDSVHFGSQQRNDVHFVVSKPLVHDETNYGSLIITTNNLSTSNHIRVYTIFIAVIALTTLTLSLILAIVFSRYIIRPVLSLGRVATNVTQTNNYALRAERITKDEIGDLTDCFNSMLENIEQRDGTLESQVTQRTEELEIANNQLKKQAYQDSLSDLPNRRYFNDKLQNNVIRYEKGLVSGFSVLFLDLDGFKEINDTMGHDHGDVLLVSVANRLKKAVRESDLVARLGGDEFTVLIEDVVDQEVTSKVCESIHNELNDPFFINGEEVTITVSIGIAIFPENGLNVETILKCADLAMYQAKAEGRNCYKYFDSMMLQRLVEKREVVSDLKKALKEEQFELHFQPIVDFASGNFTKVEALIRWNHPTKGLLYPNDFIAIAEEFGIINDIGLWVLKNTAQHVSILNETFATIVDVSVNVSPAQFKGDFKLIETWLEDCKHQNLEVSQISFEITENLLMTSDAIVKKRLKLLKDSGIDIAIDDFGVGYSSLSYLQQIEVDVLKIDRSFVRNLEKDSNSQALCKAMINMADELGIKVVAEGIEEQAQADLLISYGCRFGQGYLFAKPEPLETLIALERQTKTA